MRLRQKVLSNSSKCRAQRPAPVTELVEAPFDGLRGRAWLWCGGRRRPPRLGVPVGSVCDELPPLAGFAAYAEAMPRTRLYRDGKLQREDFDMSEVSDLIVDERNTVWVDFASPMIDDLQSIVDELSLHPLAVEGRDRGASAREARPLRIAPVPQRVRDQPPRCGRRPSSPTAPGGRRRRCRRALSRGRRHPPGHRETAPAA